MPKRRAGGQTRDDGFMRAVIFEEFGGSVDVRSVSDPAPSPGGVVLEVHATGLCRSDWHAWAGHDDITLPHVPHDLAGVVAAVGGGAEPGHC
jgi:alcohol dehydrogenase